MNFHVGEPVSASAMVAIGACVGEDCPSHYRKLLEGMMWFGGVRWGELSRWEEEWRRNTR